MPTVNLQEIKKTFDANYKNIDKKISICASTGCVSSGSLKVYDAFKTELEKRKIKVCLSVSEGCKEGALLAPSGCKGLCQQGPLLSIGDIFYTRVTPADVEELIDKTLLKGEVVERMLYKNPSDGKTFQKADDIPFFKKQTRFLLKDCSQINPLDINDYISRGGYASAAKACKDMSDEEICKLILDSGLRGRGGGGFPTGKKWDLTRIVKGDKKYVICNADEGDPGAFMDGYLMEGTPHSIIEGMIIASKAVGADEGVIYVRMEYPLAVARMRAAIKQAEELGVLGDKIFGSSHNFRIGIMEGAGAFVCGEETALIASVEGRRGMPRLKPPFPAQRGLFGKPTVINNVETYANIGKIIAVGAEEYRKMGTQASPGTKTFALTGNVSNTGLVEVAFGSTLRQIVNEIAGGTADDKGNSAPEQFKAVQIGGPSGGCLTKEHLDMPLDYDSLKAVGAMVGSGGLVVMNDKTCMVNIAKFFMSFTQHESCGKCTPCREGTRQMLGMLTDITEGKGGPGTIAVLEHLGQMVKTMSLCGLGKSAPNPVLSTLKYFKDEYLAHINDKKCPTNNCKALATYSILPEKCVGCTACRRACPVGAVDGDIKKVHKIDAAKCIKCGACKEACKFGAVVVGG